MCWCKLCIFGFLKNNFDAMINSNGVAYAGSVSIIFYTKVWYLVVAAVAGIITILISNGASHACWTDFSDRGDSPDKRYQGSQICKEYSWTRYLRNGVWRGRSDCTPQCKSAIKNHTVRLVFLWRSVCFCFLAEVDLSITCVWV